MNILTQHICRSINSVSLSCVVTGNHSIMSTYFYDDRSQHVLSGIVLPEVFFNQFTGVFHIKRGCVTERNLLREELKP
jgi:hypothetical protein